MRKKNADAVEKKKKNSILSIYQSPFDNSAPFGFVVKKKIIKTITGVS